MSEHGPLYNVELTPRSLPVGNMFQALPSADDLRRAMRGHQRLVAGYEVLLATYHESLREIERLKAACGAPSGQLTSQPVNQSTGAA
jgi:hypothetical protein